jgi:hypothetical protein
MTAVKNATAALDEHEKRWGETVDALDQREERWVDEVLEVAGERLRLGWTQGAFETTITVNGQKTRAFCLVGALRSAARALRADGYTLQRAHRSVWESLDPEAKARLHRPATPGMHNTHCLLSAWNEEPGRTKDEVIALVERTLERNRAGRPRWSTEGQSQPRSVCQLTRGVVVH